MGNHLWNLVNPNTPKWTQAKSVYGLYNAMKNIKGELFHQMEHLYRQVGGVKGAQEAVSLAKNSMMEHLNDFLSVVQNLAKQASTGNKILKATENIDGQVCFS
jgi:hypothetical protein